MTDADSRAAVRRTWAGIGQANLAADTTENDTPVGERSVERRAVDGSLPRSQACRADQPALPPPLLRSPRLQPRPVLCPASVSAYLLSTMGGTPISGWMQENPDPMTMAVWNSWVEINMQVAHIWASGPATLVRLTTAHGSIEVPAVPYPAHPSRRVAMPIGPGPYRLWAQCGRARLRTRLPFWTRQRTRQTGAFAYSATHVTVKKVASAKTGYYPGQQNAGSGAGPARRRGAGRSQGFDPHNGQRMEDGAAGHRAAAGERVTVQP